MSIWQSHVTISHSSLGGTGTNTWHGRAEDPFEDELPQWMNWIRTFYESLNSVLATGTLVAHDGQWVRLDDPVGQISTQDPFSVGITGAAGVLPPSQCLVVGWKTSVASRGGRGRTFVGPLKLDTLEGNGTPNEAHRATVKAAGDALIESSDTALNGALGVWSQDPSGTPPSPVFRDFIACAVSNKFSVLRSRRD